MEALSLDDEDNGLSARHQRGEISRVNFDLFVVHCEVLADENAAVSRLISEMIRNPLG
jgi:hypothetical protein